MKFGSVSCRALAACACLVILCSHPSVARSREAIVEPDATAAPARDALETLPMAFEANAGQTDPRVRFLARGRGYATFVTDDEVVLALQSQGPARDERAPDAASAKAAILRLKLEGASPAAGVAGERPLAGTANYIRGGDSRAWLAGVTTYGAVRYTGLYEGIDLVLYGNQRELEYDFVIAPHADPGLIRLRFEGHESVEPAADGSVVLRMGAGEVRQQRARVYQQLATGRRDVAARLEVGADGLVSLALGEYDRSLPLVVDPVLSYVYFFESGHKHDQINDMVVGADGSVYVVGETASSDFPVTPGAFDTTASLPFFSSDVRDAFVAKLDPTGSSLVYSTFLGSFGDERAYGAAVGPSGTVFAVGFTDSADFPTTPGAYDTTFNTVLRAGDEFGDVFVVELAADGASLVYSTFIGGSNSDAAYSVAADAAGAAYVIGLTWSADYPTTPGAFDTTISGGDVFVTKVNAGGASLAYSTLVGGLQGDFAQDVAVDASGNAYVTGETNSTDFPKTAGSFGDTPLLGAFVFKLNAGGTALGYSGVLRGGLGQGIAVRAGEAYVVGETENPSFPTTPGAFDQTYNSTNEPGDAFATKISADGSALVYSTFLGGDDRDVAYAVAVDAAGVVYVAGAAESTDFPTTPGAFQTENGGGISDVFVATLDPHGEELGYSTFVGGFYYDTPYAIHVDANLDVTIAGGTGSSNYPVSAGALNATFAGGQDGFVTRVDAGGAGLVFSTLLSGAADDAPHGYFVAPSGDIYVTGTTPASDFPAALFDVDQTKDGPTDAFVARLQQDPCTSCGVGPLYSTFLGGAGDEAGLAIAADTSGVAYVTGTTTSSDFPTTPGAIGASYAGGGDAFVTALTADGTGLAFSTYLGGAQADSGEGVAVDAAKNVYVAGATQSSGFPTTAGAFDTSHGGSSDGFLSRLAPDGSALGYSTFLGGAGDDRSLDVVAGPGGAVYVAGSTSSADFPTTPGAFDTTVTPGVEHDGFATLVAPDGGSLSYSTALGGAGDDRVDAVALQLDGVLVLAGTTGSADFPTTPGALDTSANGSSDAFVTKLAANGATLVASTYLGGGASDTAADVVVDADGFVYVAGSTTSTNFPAAGAGADATANGASDGYVTVLGPDAAGALYSTYVGGHADDFVYGIGLSGARGVTIAGQTASFQLPEPDYEGRTGVDVFVAVVGTPRALTVSESTAGIYLPSSGTWYVRYSNAPGAADAGFSFGPGGAGLVPIVGDWDGDGDDTPGLYAPATGAFFLRNELAGGAADVVLTFGPSGAGLHPLAGDWNGDGVDTIGVYVEATGAFFLRNENAPGPADYVFTFGPGGAGIVPLAGNWDGHFGDGIGIYLPSTGTFFLQEFPGGGAADHVFSYGPPNAVPLAGSWDANDAATPGVYVPATGAWFLRNQLTPGPADLVFTYGPPGATPVVGNWAGRFIPF